MLGSDEDHRNVREVDIQGVGSFRHPWLHFPAKYAEFFRSKSLPQTI
jgi:hypothetical protein